MTPPDDQCPDAETLAALADDMLAPAARRSVERHVADCHDCQALMAAVVRAESAGRTEATATASASVGAWWTRGWALTSFATAAVATLGIAVWVAAPQRAPQSAAQPRDEQIAIAAPVAPVVPAALPPPPPQARADRAGAGKETGAVEPAPALDSVAQAPAAKSEAESKMADATTRNEIAAPVRERAFALAAPAAAPVRVIDVVSPDARVRWRIGPGTMIQYSADGGATWTPQQADVSARLTAGSSPAPAICWVVGTAGTVLRTTDGGLHWRRVPFPESVDLGAVVGSTALAATVDLADGRRFGTTDGGQTWAAIRQ